ncbi:hypothetical protein LX64_05160 [Chitinophaga skermanii]|uniref:Mobilization protein n=1 Tax=Chitinophaga skermanii TaxID=331697 RepID=A0A327PXI4_9BACT|nr:DUF5712 family protein [Chitinophaga skermanii]RAI97015.1 hypothetical protein LX64_05160 [Chitinophaga skermanii]
MFVKVHKAGKDPQTSNKGGCSILADYLDKENKGKIQSEKMEFFNYSYDTVSKGSAVKSIDSNNKHLGKKDSKFFMLTINPSHRELQHLITRATGKTEITDISQLSKADQQKVFTELRNYTRSVMDLYAQNFERPNVKTGADLVFFAKIETQRKWHYYEKAVKDGLARSGAMKPGLNLHVHVVVSRNDRTQTTKLSPHSISKGGKQQFNGKAVQQGFNHEKFKENSGKLFNEIFSFNSKEVYHSKNYGRGMIGDKMPNMPGKGAAMVKGKVLNKVIGHESRQVINAAITVAKIAMNPASALSIAKEKLFAIAKGAVTGNEL